MTARTLIQGVHVPAEGKRLTVLEVDSGGVSDGRFESFRPRPLTVRIDDPALRGGEDSGPTAIEAVAAGVAGSLGLIASHVAEDFGCGYQRLEVELEADYDPRGVGGRDSAVFPGYSEIRIRVRVDGCRPVEDGPRLAAEVERRSPPVRMLRLALPVRIEWTFD